jgi:hypothetical protein
MRVRLKNSASNVTRTAAMPAAARSNFDTLMPVGSAIHASGSSWMPISRPRTFAPHSSCARPSIRKLKPIVAMNSEICG